MNREEQLQRIRAKCVELLAIAEKRTQGEWLINQTQPTTICDGDRECTIASTRGLWPKYGTAENDATFIAACAGAAEAGWRATIAAIDALQSVANTRFTGWDGDAGTTAKADDALDAIIAAWEGLV